MYRKPAVTDLYCHVLPAPEAISDILESTIHQTTVEALIGGSRLQGTKMFDIGSHFYIVKIFFIDHRRNAYATTIPGHMELRMIFVNILCKLIDPSGIGIPSHEGDTGYVCTIL